jgi:hypothetical protein
MLRKRKRRTRRETMASTELISEAKRFCNDLQYLTNKRTKKGEKEKKTVQKFGSVKSGEFFYEKKMRASFHL